MASILGIKTKIKLRNKCNKLLCRELQKFLFQNPELRFGQALIILGICPDVGNIFNEESIDTYSKIVSKLNEAHERASKLKN